MKRKLLHSIVAVITIMVVLYSQNTYCFAFTTWEEAREWFRENGIPVSQGGTYDEYSIHSGQDVPQYSTSTNSTQGNVEKPAQPVHKHSYIETITKESTCIEEGLKTFICSCGEKYTESIQLVEHTYDKSIIIQEATCTVNGKRLISCSVCNDTYEEDIEVLGHENGEWVMSKPATCTEKGEEVVNCTRCGKMLESKETEPHGHKEGKVVITKKATPFTKGLKETKCITCEEVMVSEEIPINMNAWYIIISMFVIIVIIVIIKKIKTSKTIK